MDHSFYFVNRCLFHREMFVLANLVDSLKSQAWIAAILLLFVAVFRDVVKNAITTALNAMGRMIYRRLAGNRLLRRRALRKYKRGLLAAAERIPIPFRPNRPLVLSEIYVSLRITESQEKAPADIWSTLAAHPRLVVTGPPGAGKSMLLRHLAASKVEKSGGRIPVLLELHRLVRDAEHGASIEDHLVDAFDRYGFPRAKKFLRIALDKGWLVLLLDGLDEVPTADRGEVAARLSDFLERERSCPAIVTCRSAVYRGELDAVVDRRVELEPLEDQQIQAFLDSWGEPMPAGKSPGQLMSALREQPKLLAAARNPLLLTIITHLYSDRPTYALPRSRADFYSQAAEILLDQWQGHLGQNKFEGPEKKAVLCGLALEMQETARDPDQDRRTVSREEAFSCIRQVMPTLGLDEDQVGDVVREIVERSGLLLQIDGGSRYAFAHLTFQEYFAAEALRDRSSDLAERFASDADAWREVVVLWCGLAPNGTQLVEKVRSADPDTALACVAEARSVDQALADAVLDPVLNDVLSGTASEESQRGLGAVAADVRPRGESVLRALVEGLAEAVTEEARLSIGTALSVSNRLPAAEAIVRRLGEEPGLAECVIRMGGLAVASLREAGEEEGCHVAACACLARIGTADAAGALAHVMVSERGSETPAAWGLSHVITSPSVVDELKAFDLPGGVRPRSMTWIWQPFSKPGEENLIWLIGRAAALIEETRDLDLAIACPDPRIATALCTLDLVPLRAPFDRSRITPELVQDVNALSTSLEYQFNEAGRLTASVEAPARSSFEGRPGGIFSRRIFEIETVGDLIGLALSGTMDPLWLSEELDLAKVERFVDRLLGELGGEYPVWEKLVRELPPGLRVSVLRRTSPPDNGRLSGEIGPNTWSSVCVVSPFRFRKSSYYALILGGVGMLTAMAFWGGALVVLNSSSLGSLEALLALLGCASVGLSWLWIFAESQPSVSFGRVDPDSLALALVGPLAVPIVLVEELGSPPVLWWDVFSSIPTVGFSAALLALSGVFLNTFISLSIVVSFLLALVFVGIVLAFRGTRREASLRSPLIGLFPQAEAS